MSEPSDAASGKDATPSKPASASKQSFDHLPQVDSPSISPAGDEPVTDETTAGAAGAGPAGSDETKAADAPEPPGTAPGQLIVLPRADRPRMKKKITVGRRARRSALRAATVLIAAGLGAVAGVLSMHVLPSAASKPDAASLEQRQAMQKSIVLLAKEVNALKANADKAAKSAQTPVGKTAARIDAVKPSAKHDDNIVTGSIKPPVSAAQETIAAATVAAITAPLPQPRPPIVQGWSAYVAPDGAVLVEQQGGDLFQVSPGVPLPGLGRVEAIRRDGGRVDVVTAKGIVTSPPQRTVRNRYYRPPPFFEPY